MFTTEDKAFVRAILANPAELTAWLVYADWLDEHDNPIHAEFLRLMGRRCEPGGTEPDDSPAEARLQELRATLDRNWVTVFDRPKIENCEAAFQFVCPKQWENLKVTGLDPTVRHCDACNKKVHYCRTLPEAQSHARQGHCVAVQLGVLRRPDDLKPVVRESTAVLDHGILVRRMIAPEPRRRRPWWKFW